MAATDNILAMLGNTGGGSQVGKAVMPPASNSLAGMGAGMSPNMKALLEKLKRQSAFQGFDGIMSLLQLLENGILPGNEGGGGGGGGGCLHGDTLVRMADGSEKPAREIVVEDLIMGYDFGMYQERPQSVFTVQSSRQPCLKVTIGDVQKIPVEIVASTTHEWFVLQNENDDDPSRLVCVATCQLKPGDALYCSSSPAEGYDEHLNWCGKVLAIEDAGSHIVYWWNCTMNHNYYAGGVLHHNEGGGLGSGGASNVNTLGGNSFYKGTGGGGGGFTLGTGSSSGAGSE